MRFIVMRKADVETEAGMPPSPELIEAMGAYMAEMTAAGVLLGGDGLKASSNGARIKFRGGKPMVTDGPFAEAKELVAGYSIIEVASKAEAIEWIRRWPQIDGHGEVEIELRELFEFEDFEPLMTPEGRALHAAANTGISGPRR